MRRLQRGYDECSRVSDLGAGLAIRSAEDGCPQHSAIAPHKQSCRSALLDRSLRTRTSTSAHQGGHFRIALREQAGTYPQSARLDVVPRMRERQGLPALALPVKAKVGGRASPRRRR
jgi:hypothetical protein